MSFKFKKSFISFFILIFSAKLVLADVVNKSTYGFCFKRPTSLQQVQSALGGFALPNDQLEMMGNCVEALLSESRAELYEKLLSANLGLSDTYKSSRGTNNQGQITTLTGGSSNQGHCRLEYEKKRNKEHHQRTIGIGKNGNFRDREENLEGNERSQILLSLGKPGSLRVDDISLDVVCTGGNSGNFTLNFSLSGRQSGISTSVEVGLGQVVNIGGIAKDLSGKDRTIDINRGFEHNKSSGKDNFEYYLKVLGTN